jgi:hypothetical protein
MEIEINRDDTERRKNRVSKSQGEREMLERKRKEKLRRYRQK